MARNEYTEEWLQQHLARKAKRLQEDLARVPVPADPPPPHPPKKERMNKTEARYAAEFLEPMKRAGEILHFGFEAVKLRLADNTWFTPDFAVWERDSTLTMHETKGGFIREDAWLKLKMAAEQYPHIVFIVAQLQKGAWTMKYVGR